MARMPIKKSAWQIRIDAAIDRLESFCDETDEGWKCRETGKIYVLSIGDRSIHVYEA